MRSQKNWELLMQGYNKDDYNKDHLYDFVTLL